MRAWSVGAAPAVAELTLDLDSTVCEVCGKAKQGACYGHTKVLGYHPLVAVRADTGEVLHSRMRSGSSQRGQVHFARETLARVRRLAAGASVTVRADSGFFSYDMIGPSAPATPATRSRSHRTLRSKQPTRPSARTLGRRSRTPAAARPRWLRPPSKQAAAATSCAATTVRHAPQPPARRAGRAVAQLALPQLRHQPRRPRHQSSRRLPPKPRHRRARHQRPQRRLRAQPLPLGTVLRQRRLARLLRARAQPRPLDRPPRPRPTHNAAVAATIRNRLLTAPGRLVNHSGRHRLRLPLNWPWANTFITALRRGR